VIHDLSDVILSVKSPHFDCVSVLFSIVRGATSPEFVVKSLFAIYELSQTILEHIHLLTYQFREFEDLFELLLLDIEAYPLFIPLLCVLSLPKSQADKNRVAQAISKSATIRTDQLWLTWPMVFCLSVDDICQTLVCHFLARICRLPELISFVVDFFQICNEDGLITKFMSFVFENQQGKQLSRLCMSKCFELVFFHCHLTETHCASLLELFESSEFECEKCGGSQEPSKVRIVTFGDLLGFVSQDFEKLEMGCRVRIDRSYALVDRQLLELGAEWPLEEASEIQGLMKGLRSRARGIAVVANWEVLEEAREGVVAEFERRIRRTAGELARALVTLSQK
jgi:hypothetical protein